MGKGKKSKKNEVAIAWYCEARHEMIYGLLKLAENSELDVIMDCDREDVKVVYFDEGQNMLTFGSDPEVCYVVDAVDLDYAQDMVIDLIDSQQDEELEFDQPKSTVVHLHGESGVPGCEDLNAEVYASGVRIDGDYGKRCWITADDLLTLVETLQEVQDRA